MGNVKSINSLMAHLRDGKSIEIRGSLHKRKLRNLGYYHGYKGYRFIKNTSMPINLTNFDEIIALNKFDMELKSLFYPKIMFLETALKNYSLEVILDESKSDSFNNIYENILTEYKHFSPGSKNYNNAYTNRLKVRDTIYKTLTTGFYKKRQVVQHFYNDDRQVPIWAIFETITLGDFGNMLNCVDRSTRLKICNELKLNQAFNSIGLLICDIVFVLKELRNSLAHNNVIFDCRFKARKIDETLILCLENDMGITNINFETIVDYVILIVYLLKNIQATKLELNAFVSSFEIIINEVRKNIKISEYSKILHTDTRNKINLLKTYIKL
ncbi:MAG: Abi family protein [Clostridium sp.]|uniref:Abi family protein n=1 Tax=Clostridium TaxID=1485 RepID=UPI0028FF39B1|nr:Abi family protein [Clostridium sp.]MDU1280425.1 Abi family protein [Clostridium sp.]